MAARRGLEPPTSTLTVSRSTVGRPGNKCWFTSLSLLVAFRYATYHFRAGSSLTNKIRVSDL